MMLILVVLMMVVTLCDVGGGGGDCGVDSDCNTDIIAAAFIGRVGGHSSSVGGCGGDWRGDDGSGGSVGVVVMHNVGVSGGRPNHHVLLPSCDLT